MAPRGFTLLELTVVVALTLLLTGLGIGFTLIYVRGQTLERSVESVVGEIRRAQTDALAQTLGDRGVAVFADRVVRFSGSSYATRAQSLDTTTSFVQPVAVGGDSEFVFPAGSVAPDAAGTMTLSDQSRFADLTVNAYGVLQIAWRRQ
jgi:prepilin-type N-terminal cleavage/methylation domain-containing protein